LIAVFAAMGLMVVSLSTVAVVSFLDVDEGLDLAAARAFAAMATASSLSQQAEGVVAQAPTLVAASSPAERRTMGLRVQDQLNWLRGLIEEMAQQDHDPVLLGRIRVLSEDLRERLDTLSRHVDRRLALETEARTLRDRLIDLDRRVSEKPLADPLEEVRLWRRDMGETVVLLLAAMGAQGTERDTTLEARFRRYLETTQARIPKLGRGPYDGLTQEVRFLGLGEHGVFAVLDARRAVDRAVAGTLARSRLTSDMLTGAAAHLMDAASNSAKNEARRLRGDLRDRTAVLLTLSMFCLLLVGVLVLHLNRAVLDPLARLRDAMRQPIEAGPPRLVGLTADDEFGDMARALEHYATLLDQRERALSASERRFRAMAANLPGMLFQWREVVEAEGRPPECGRFVYVGPRCQDLFGLDPEIVARNWRALPLTDDDGRIWTERAGRAALTMGHWIQEGRVDRLDGTVQWWRLIAASATGDQPGEVILNGMITDVTGRKMAERETEEARLRAERALTDLRATQDTLVRTEKLASLGQLVAGIAHEVNTPLGTGITGASFLAEECQAVSRTFRDGGLRRSELEIFLAQAGETAGLILANLRRAASLIQGFKQVAVDQVTEDRRIFDLADYVGEVLGGLGPRLRKTRLTVERDLPSGFLLDGYPGALARVLTNLVMNSLLHGFDPEDKGTIRITARRLEPDWVEVVYSDTGRGIPQDIQSRVFDPFFTTRRGSGGTGLGLNIVHNLVTRTLGGGVTLESDEGRGVRFVLRLPRRAPDAPPDAVVEAAPVAPIAPPSGDWGRPP
jgi:PAS domain S-box-containing protein